MTSRPVFARFVLSAVVVLGGILGGCLPRRPYEPCSVNADCPVNTQCLQITAMGDRICTSTCSTGGCPLDRFGTDARCLSFDGGATAFCFQACAAGGGGTECPFRYGCFTEDAAGTTFPAICLPERGSSGPTQRAYENCTADSQCLDSTRCGTVNGVGMCTINGCRDELDCPLDRFGTTARCLSFDGGGLFTCFQACNITAGGAECSTGWTCADNDGTSSFPPICLPR